MAKIDLEKFSDGDILVCGDDKRPFIYKGMSDRFHPRCPMAYCGIGIDGTFVVNTGDGWWTDRRKRHPPTANKNKLRIARIVRIK